MLDKIRGSYWRRQASSFCLTIRTLAIVLFWAENGVAEAMLNSLQAPVICQSLHIRPGWGHNGSLSEQDFCPQEPWTPIREASRGFPTDQVSWEHRAGRRKKRRGGRRVKARRRKDQSCYALCLTSHVLGGSKKALSMPEPSSGTSQPPELGAKRNFCTFKVTYSQVSCLRQSLTLVWDRITLLPRLAWNSQLKRSSYLYLLSTWNYRSAPLCLIPAFVTATENWLRE
jgi:hypothetical protein